MKGFPNQVADLRKLATAMACIVRLEKDGQNSREDGVLGEELVRAGVAGTGHAPVSVDIYLREQLKKSKSNQAFRTTARGLRELFRLMKLIDDSSGEVQVTEAGKVASSFDGKPLDSEQIGFWRRIVTDIEHAGSHPYLVLLRLVGRKPGISRAKCALALEADDDSNQELDRIVGLVDLEEEEIRRVIRVTKSNWDNAKKVLPRFAEQLGDVVRSGGTYVIAASPGAAKAGERSASRRFQVPRASRKVTAETIAVAGTNAKFDDVDLPPPDADPEAIVQANKKRANRLRRHNLLVREFAELATAAEATLFEDPFDVLAVFQEVAVLAEMKTLDGTTDDERDRVRHALAQLLYYETFLVGAITGDASVHKIACFESEPTEEHRDWLNGHGIGVIWKADDNWCRDSVAKRSLGQLIEEFR